MKAKKIAKQLIIKEMINHFLEGNNVKQIKELAYDYTMEPDTFCWWDCENGEFDEIPEKELEELENGNIQREIYKEIEKEFDDKVATFILGYAKLINEFKKI
jgi:hypothetical protein